MVELGKEYKDAVTGFKGIAIAKCEWLNGCSRITLQPKCDKTGKIPDNATFDEPQLVFVGSREVKRGKNDTGGPLDIKLQQNVTPQR
jgi:hypothetical protein